MMNYLDRKEKVALGLVWSLLLAIIADSGIGLYRTEKELNKVRRLKTNTLTECVDFVSERLPENRREDLRKMQIYVGGKGAVPYTHIAHCDRSHVYIYLPEPYPQVLTHEFAHYVFDCKLSDSELCKLKSDMNALGSIKIGTNRGYSEAFAEMYRKHVFDTESIKPKERKAEYSVASAMGEK